MVGDMQQRVASSAAAPVGWWCPIEVQGKAESRRSRRRGAGIKPTFAYKSEEEIANAGWLCLVDSCDHNHAAEENCKCKDEGTHDEWSAVLGVKRVNGIICATMFGLGTSPVGMVIVKISPVFASGGRHDPNYWSPAVSAPWSVN